MKPPTLPSRYSFSGRKYEGGQSVAFSFRDSYLERDVLAKVYKDVRDAEQLKSEIECLTLVNSKHIVEVYDVIYKNGSPIGIIEEFIPGKDLKKVRINIEDPPSYIRLLYQLSCGISDMHSSGCIHRDIKLNNLKLDSEEVLKIFDFGFSSLNEDNPHTIESRGTLVYRAPELYGPPPIPVTAAVDTYAFGVCAWNMIAARPPEALTEIPPQSRSARPSFSSLPLAIPEYLVDILDQTLNVTPEQRPRMVEVKNALERALLHDKHQGTLVFPPFVSKFHKDRKSVKIKLGTQDLFVVEYDGHGFFITPIHRGIYINNTPVERRLTLPSSCVITVESVGMGIRRHFMTFDASHPEVIV